MAQELDDLRNLGQGGLDFVLLPKIYRDVRNIKVEGKLAFGELQIEVPGVKFKDLVSKEAGETSEKIRERVSRGRARQLARFRGKKIYANAQMGTKEIKQYCSIGAEAQKLLESAHLFG